MNNVRLIVDAFAEGNDAYPIVTHIFRGDSVKEVQERYQAHLAHDAMLQGCTLLHHALGFGCWTVARWDYGTERINL